MEGAASGLDEVLSTALFQAFDQVDRFTQVDDRGIRSGGAKTTGETFQTGDLGPDQEILVRNSLADAFIQVKGNWRRFAQGPPYFHLRLL